MRLHVVYATLRRYVPLNKSDTAAKRKKKNRISSAIPELGEQDDSKGRMDPKHYVEGEPRWCVGVAPSNRFALRSTWLPGHPVSATRC